LRVSSSANKRLRYSASTDGLLLGRVADDAKGTGSLSVETHVLGERLGQDGLVTLGDKVSQGKGVVVDVSRGETLVGLRKREKRVAMSASVVSTVSQVVSHHVEEGEVTLLLEDVAELLPLLVSGVNTGRVVRTTIIQRSKSITARGQQPAECCTYACKRIIELLGAFCKMAAARPHFDQPIAQALCQQLG
jgi:hypothetical protein